MQTFQQYYPINQNYNQQMQPNPYMQRMEQLQQFQQSLQPPIQQPMQNQFPALGKVVENIDTVKTTEIPYQGVYYFPTADGCLPEPMPSVHRLQCHRRLIHLRCHRIKSLPKHHVPGR